MSKYKLPPNFPKGFIALKEMEHIGARVKPEVYEKWQKLLFMPDGYEQRNTEDQDYVGAARANTDLLEYMVEHFYELIFENKEETNE
tara:strand:+ start:365 stop:625 length:261 start_codon:yes stop_codon:yes gene_type:complete